MNKKYQGYRVDIFTDFDSGLWGAMARVRPVEGGDIISLLTFSYATAEAAESAMWKDAKRTIDEMVAVKNPRLEDEQWDI